MLSLRAGVNTMRGNKEEFGKCPDIIAHDLPFLINDFLTSVSKTLGPRLLYVYDFYFE